MYILLKAPRADSALTGEWATTQRRRSYWFPVLFTLAVILLPDSPAYASTGSVQSLLEMRHKNVVIQKWDLSCGAAALTTLLNYQHGENLTEKEVAVTLMNRPEYIDNPQLIQIREGFSLLDLKRYAEARGYKDVGLGKVELKDLVEKTPVLVPIKPTATTIL
jgi:predicted double-glycine peptidase